MGGDSNPRYLLGTHAFQACALDHSATHPCTAFPPFGAGEEDCAAILAICKSDIRVWRLGRRLGAKNRSRQHRARRSARKTTRIATAKKTPNAAMPPFGRLDSLPAIACSSVSSLSAKRGRGEADWLIAIARLTIE